MPKRFAPYGSGETVAVTKVGENDGKLPGSLASRLMSAELVTKLGGNEKFECAGRRVIRLGAQF